MLYINLETQGWHINDLNTMGAIVLPVGKRKYCCLCKDYFDPSKECKRCKEQTDYLKKLLFELEEEESTGEYIVSI